MMQIFNKPFNQTMDRLINRLADAHQYRTATPEQTNLAPTDSRWQQNVMRSVRQIGPIDAKNNNRERFGYLSWRLAPVAAVLLILMSIWIARVDDTLEFQIAGLVVSDPAQTDVYNPF